MQSELIQAYQRFKKATIFENSIAERLSPPLLLKVSKSWKNSKKRVLIVGQETFGWEFKPGNYYSWPYEPILSFKDFLYVDNAIDAMVHAYSSFEFAKHQPKNFNSPFWSAYREIREANGDINDGIDTTVLWTNLFRMDLDGESVLNESSDEAISIQKASGKLLREEIEILKPTSVIFFTGPKYNDALYATFGKSLSPFNAYDPSRTSFISHDVLPKRTIRTYHPGYLNRGHWHILEQIIEEVVK